MSTTVTRILSVLLVLAGSALATPVVARANIPTCIYDKTMEFTRSQANVMRAEGRYPPGVNPEDFKVFLEDCCAKADSNHQPTGSPAFYNAVPGDEKAAADVEKLSTPGEKLPSTHPSFPFAHPHVDSSPANADGNAHADANANVNGENEGPKTLPDVSDGLRTGQNSDPNTSAHAKPKIAAVRLGPSLASIPVDKQSTTSADANANANSSPSADSNANANVDKDAPKGLHFAEKPTNEQPNLAKTVAADLASTPDNSAVHSQNTVNQILSTDPARSQSSTHADSKVAADAHSQSPTHADADANTDADTDPKAHSTPAVEKVLGAMGPDDKCKCPL